MFLDDEDFVGRRFKGKSGKDYKTPVLSVNARLNRKRTVKSKRARIVSSVTVLVIALVVLLGFGIRWVSGALFWNNGRYEIKYLVIRGGRAIKEARIREYTGISEGTNLFAVNISDVRKELNTVPNIRDIEIARILPDTMVINVSERMPMARVGFRGAYPIDEDGYVFVARRKMRGLPFILGDEARELRPGQRAPSRVGAALKVIQMCDRHDISLDVSSIETDNEDYLTVRLASGKFAHLHWEGMYEDTKKSRERLERKLREWISALENSRGQRDMRFDLTLDDIRSKP